MRKTLLSILAVAILLGAASFGFAQGEMKPIATVSFAGYDRLKADIGVIGRLVGNPKLADMLEMMLKGKTQGKGLTGLDTKRPWGVAVFARPGNAPNLPDLITYGFVPVTDLKQLMEAAKSNPKFAAAITSQGVYEIGAKEMYEISVSNLPLCVQQKGNWAIIVGNRKDLANAPADPLKLLGDLPKNYDIAVRVSVKDIPASMRQMGMAQLQAMASMSRMHGGNGGVASPAQALAPLVSMLDELDSVTLGLKIDPGTSKSYLDLEVTAKAGTKLAERFVAMKLGKTAFAGVQIPEAAVVLNRHDEINADDLAQVQAALAGFHKRFLDGLGQQELSEDQVNLMTRFSTDLLDVLQKTLATKKIDGGLAMLLEPGAATVVGGATVVDGAKLEKALQQLVDGLKKTDPEAAKLIKFNAETHEGVHFHKLSIPTPHPMLVPMFGDTLDLVLGTAADKVMLGVGRNAAKTLKKVLDQSKAAADKEVPPLQIKLAVGKIVKFLAEVAPDENTKMKVAMLAGALEKVGDKDHVTVTNTPISQGVRMRVEMEEGLLKAMASMGQMAMSMGAMPPGGPPAPPPPPPK